MFSPAYIFGVCRKRSKAKRDIEKQNYKEQCKIFDTIFCKSFKRNFFKKFICFEKSSEAFQKIEKKNQINMYFFSKLVFIEQEIYYHFHDKTKTINDVKKYPNLNA